MKGKSAEALLCVVCCGFVTVAHAQGENGVKAEKPAAKAAAAKKAPAAKGAAYVRVLHALPQGAALDVWIDGKKVLSNVAFETLSDYLPVSSGRRDIAFSSAGTTTNVLHLKQAVTHDKFYTLVAYPVDGKPALLAVNESSGTSVADKARLYGVNVLASALVVDLTKPSTRTKNGYAMLFKTLKPGQAHSKRMTPGKLTVQLRGSDHEVKGTEETTLEANHRYTVFALGGATPDLIVAPAATQ
jgi:hypothetical protein